MKSNLVYRIARTLLSMSLVPGLLLFWSCNTSTESTKAEKQQTGANHQPPLPAPPPPPALDTATVSNWNEDGLKPTKDTAGMENPGTHVSFRRYKLNKVQRSQDWDSIKARPAPDGKVVFDWPSRMKTDETYLIHLAIACNMPLQYLQAQVDSLAEVDTDTTGQHRRRHNKTQVQLGRHMKAELMGASANDANVTISRPPDDDGNRTIDLQTDTSVVWSWNVTPRKEGPLKLTMYLTRVDEHDSRPVDVETILVQGIKPGLFDQITNFFTKANALWALLSTGVVGALIKFLQTYFARTKQAQANELPK